MTPVLVSNADRMMTRVNPTHEGIEVLFADGRSGLIPFGDIPEIGNLAGLTQTALPNPYQLILQNRRGETLELPWDFARVYCDDSYRPRIETVAAAGRQLVGRRVQQLREAARLTQEELASMAGIGRVTLVRLENGGQSPRYETLAALAGALHRPLAELVADGPGRVTANPEIPKEQRRKAGSGRSTRRDAEARPRVDPTRAS